MAPFQAFKVQPKSITVPFKDLYPVTVAITKYEHCFCKGSRLKASLTKAANPFIDFLISVGPQHANTGFLLNFIIMTSTRCIRFSIIRDPYFPLQLYGNR